jgi:glycine cleavage system H protein
VNDGLNDTPEKVNGDPYGEAWFIKLKMENPLEADAMLSAVEYEEYLSSQG